MIIGIVVGASAVFITMGIFIVWRIKRHRGNQSDSIPLSYIGSSTSEPRTKSMPTESPTEAKSIPTETKTAPTGSTSTPTEARSIPTDSIPTFTESKSILFLVAQNYTTNLTAFLVKMTPEARRFFSSCDIRCPSTDDSYPGHTVELIER